MSIDLFQATFWSALYYPPAVSGNCPGGWNFYSGMRPNIPGFAQARDFVAFPHPVLDKEDDAPGRFAPGY